MIVVLGMHKSGTTLVARFLQEAGIDMVETVSGGTYDDGNHYERRETAELNKAALNCGHRNSAWVRRRCDPRAVPASVRDEAERLVRRSEGTGKPWGFKDPRTCLTYEFWRTILPSHKVVAIYRDPVEVYKHYTARVRGSSLLQGFVALRAWYAYNTVIDTLTRGCDPPVLLLEFGKLMSDDRELGRLTAFIGRSVSDVREPSLARSRTEPTLDYRAASGLCRHVLSEDVGALYDSLRRLREDQAKLIG